MSDYKNRSIWVKLALVFAIPLPTVLVVIFLGIIDEALGDFFSNSTLLQSLSALMGIMAAFLFILFIAGGWVEKTLNRISKRWGKIWAFLLVVGAIRLSGFLTDLFDSLNDWVRGIPFILFAASFILIFFETFVVEPIRERKKK